MYNNDGDFVMKTFIIVLSLGVFLFTFWFFIVYRKIAKLNRYRTEKFLELDILLINRLDIVASLASFIKDHTSSKYISKVIEYRNKAVESRDEEESIKYNIKMGKYLALVLDEVSGNRDLKKNADFLKLRRDLEVVEAKIKNNRSIYNDAVKVYNDSLVLFPNNFISYVSGLKKHSLYDVSLEEKKMKSFEL